MDLFGLKDLYELLKKMDDEIAFAAEGARIHGTSIGPDLKKAIKATLLEILEKIHEMKEKLEKALEKACGVGRWIRQCELMNRYLENLIRGGNINDIPERLVTFLNDLKRYIIEALPYEIGHGMGELWYRKLCELDQQLQEVLGHLEQAGSAAHRWALADATRKIAWAKKIKDELEPLLAD